MESKKIKEIFAKANEESRKRGGIQIQPPDYSRCSKYSDAIKKHRDEGVKLRKLIGGV